MSDQQYRYSPTHEWIKLEDKSHATIGITRYAVQELGQIVYAQLPDVGRKVVVGEEVVVLESTKAAADIYAPVSGIITEVHTALLSELHKLNEDPEGEGWLFKMEVDPYMDDVILLDQKQYQELIVS